MDRVETEGRQPLRRLNLNLLYPLNAILHSRTLTEAGRLISLSQPAMSAALRRLREHFRDELVVYAAGERFLTPLARSLRPLVERALCQADQAFEFSLDFDPPTSTEAIRLSAPGAVEVMFLTSAIKDMMAEAPGLRFDLVPYNASNPTDALDRGADIVLVPDHAVDSRFRERRLFRESLSCMVWNKHPTIHLSISPEQFASARHVVVTGRDAMLEPIDDEGRQLLEARSVAVTTGLLSSLPGLVEGTDLVATGSSWLLQHLASFAPLQVLIAPFAHRHSAIFAQWQAHRVADPKILWVLECLADAVRRGPVGARHPDCE